MTPQETDPDLPVNVQESPVDVWVDSGLPRGQRHEYNSPGSRDMLASVLLKEVTITPTGQTTGREHSPTHQQKIGLKIY